MHLSSVDSSKVSQIPEKVHTHLEARNFEMSRTLHGLKGYLEKAMQVKWFEGSKAYIGDYISVRKDTGTIIRIFKDRIGYSFDMLNKTGCAEEKYKSELEDFQRMLLQSGARDFEVTEDFY